MMRPSIRFCALLIVACALSAAETFAAAPTTRPADIDDVPLKAPPRGAPMTRIGGAARGGNMPAVFLFAPQTVGLTTRAQPTFYWYLSRDTNDPIDFVIAKPGQPRPIVRKTLQGPTKAGVHSIDLGQENVSLQPGVEYKVTVLVQGAPQLGGESAFSTGLVRRVAPPPALAAGGQPDQFAYGREGIWYDAVDAVSRQIAANPADPHLRRQRLSLLRQEHVFAGAAVVPGGNQATEDQALEDFMVHDGMTGR